ncbi:MAG TPA: ATP-binding protein [Terriglobales bacterium]|nr:ATP-binding protein [Terriglobales bacterium]
MKRRKKPQSSTGGTATAAEAPLQPKYPDFGQPTAVEPEPQQQEQEAAPALEQPSPETASRAREQGGSAQKPKRRRRRGGRGRGTRPQGAGQPARGAAVEAEEPGGAEQPAFLDPDAPRVVDEARAPEHRPSEFDRQASVPTAAVPISKATRGVVVLAIGLPGSGKSTWFKRHSVVPLSSDLLRTILFDDVTQQRYQDLVFSTLRALLRARLIAHMPWNYVDATNLSPHERRGWIKMARDFGYEVHALFFDVPVEVCVERNRRRERVVPEDVMQRMASKLRPPTFDEGFSKITVVRVKHKPE